ncbi:MAG: ATP-binding protein [Burkholderiaceae bacterium]|nr:ATP-binding protein [Burkholderiaceae bacterium]
MADPTNDLAAVLASDRRRKLQMLATQPDSVFELFVRSAVQLTESDVAAISLVGEEWQWFKAGIGLDSVHIPRSMSFCAEGVASGSAFEVADATTEPRFAQHPLVARDAGLRSYAGHPIEFEGECLGMLFVMSARSRLLNAEQQRWLHDLARGATEAAASHERIFKLQISERRLLDFASASSDWLWETDSSHRYTWLSDRFEDLTGLTVLSQVNRNPPESPMRDGAGRVVEPRLGFHEVLDRQQSFARVVVLKPTPLGDRLISYSAIAKFRSDGMFKGYRGSAQDVTHRIGAERQEREVSDTLRLLAQHVPGVLYQRVSRPDGTGYCPYASESVRQVFELTPDELAQDCRPMLDRVHPEDRNAVEFQIRAAEVSGQPWSQTFRVMLPTAGLRVLSGFASSRRMPDGNVLWHGFATDVTESEKAAAEIARSGQQWELASQAAGIGIFELNLSTATITLDRNGCQVHRLPAESPTSFVLAQWLDMLEPSARESAQAFISLAAVSGGIQREVLGVVSTTGDPRRIEFVARAQASPDRARSRTPVLIGVCRDITEEYALERLRQEMAETREANRSKSELLSRISHELRTPLNGILGFAQLLEGDRKEPLTGVQKQRVQTIRMSGTRLLSLVNDVLELSRVEQQMFSLQRESVSVNDVVSSGIALLQPLALERAVRVEFIGAEHAVYAKADRRAMDQLFTNLLSNAIKYNRAGGHVNVVVEPLGASKVQISIEDTGMGMSVSQLDQLFQPFNRVGAEKTQIEGTGLGLVIARELTQGMGGTIEVTSTPNTGSCFTVKLPLAKGSRTGRDSTDSMPAQTDWIEAAGGTALYIEDDPVNAMLMREVFGRLGNWKLLEASTGAEGLRLARAEQPQLLLTDMNLPDMSGLDIVKQIRQHPATRSMHVIAVTADALPQQQEMAKQIGVDGYWTKPLDLALILKHLRGFFSSSPDFPPSTK